MLRFLHTILNYIVENPPFVGARLMTPIQEEDITRVFGKLKGSGNLDYVSAWYKKSGVMMQGSNIRAALVSANSITQGEPAAILWNDLLEAA